MTSGNDMKAARETYAGFTNMMKYAAITIAIIAAFVIFLIASHR